ncbi:nuclear pore complex protein DDB_G0274915-like isoform X2 [Mizuhopecten yessoensis]|nr:nuclear pore complex protein DDB_G0274915-like isoform X2 [Mizuhopecten yessoensis]
MTHANRGGFGDGSARARRGEDLSSEDDDEFELNDKFSGIIPPSVAFNNCLKDHCGEDIDLYGKRTDNDSGIYNSSKATTSIGSYSDQEYESDGEERHGTFDYFPSQQTTVKVHKARVGCSLDYDEAHEVEDSDKDSPRYDGSNDSPRYDHSLSKTDNTDFGTEMKTFRTVRSESDDFMTDDDSDSEKFTPHRKLYQRKCAVGRNKSGGNYYTPMTRESKEEYGSLSTSTFSFDRSKKALHNTTASSLRTSGVDENINFPLTSTCPKSYGSTSSHGVKVETTYSRYHKSSKDLADRGPPFGQGQDQLGKVGSSISTLISNSQSAHISNLPEGRPILLPGPDLGVDNGKKRKKKKKGSKDDLDDKGKKADFDENGNPRLSDVSQLMPNSYMQMREPPQPVDRGATASKTRFRQNQNGCFPSKLEQLENYPFSGQQVRDLEDLSAAQSSADSANAPKKSRKKVKKEKVIRAEEVENYVGDKDVSELVKFIEQDNGGPAAKKAVKKLNHTTTVPLPTTNDAITTTVKTTEKNAKKSRDKKHRLPVNNKVVEGHSGRERSESGSALSGKEEEEEVVDKVTEDLPSVQLKQDEDIELEAVIVENPIAVQSKDSLLLLHNTSVSVNTMGNSYGRTSKEENELITSEESVIGACEKLNNDMSGENNKDFSKLVTQNNHVVHSIGKVKINSLHENDKIHEDKSVQNNKKKMGSVTVTTSASVNNNKKTDKAKNATGEEKLVTGATNNIKHNNNKNSKVKGEVTHGETFECEGQTKSDNAKVVPSKASASSVAAANVKNNVVMSEENYGNYIFTDLDLPAAEPEFTIVGKKKKRPVTGQVHTTPQMIKEPNNSNHSIKNGSVHATLRTVGRVERPRKPVPRSVTPPPRNSLSTTDSIDSERLRDLSPSSFPALSSSSSSINCGRQTFREGRRNSTGDVPCKEIALKVQDDSSDIESVKSLPVAPGGPILPVSYAKMAASPKPSNTSLAGSSGEAEEVYDSSQEANKEWKSANWKGSPTERRHSIGSSPENNLKETDNMLQTRLKYGGSQELLLAPGEAEEESVAPGEQEAVSPVASPSACFMSEDPFEVVVSSASAPICSKVMFGDVTMASVSRKCKGTNSLSDHKVSVSPSTINKTLLPEDVGVVTPLRGNGDVESAPLPSMEGVNGAPGECILPLKEPSPKCGGQQTKSLVPPTKHQIGNGRKVHKNKSVIFLDKKMNQVPKNLDITFGFELAIDTDSVGISQGQCNVVDDTSLSSTSSPSATSVLSHQSSPSESDVPSVDINSVITSSHQHSHSETSNEMCITSSLTFDNEKCKQSVVTNLSKDNISKISHSLSGKNGVVLPKTDHCEIVLSASVETSNMALHNCQTSKSTIENKISSDPDIPKGNNSRPNSIVVSYGNANNKLMDVASSIPSASDKTDCARQLRFVPEKNVDKACFNMAEAVSYVVREWDKFVQLKDKNPANLVVYSSSE